MTPLDAGSPLERAIRYARRWPVFPCIPSGPRAKTPCTKHGFYDATRDPERIERWWRRWPDATIGLPTGAPTGLVVLDIDVKNGVDGFTALAALGRDISIYENETARVRTRSGGLHVYFDTGGRAFRSSKGQTGLGRGLDVRGIGGYVIAPAPGNGYEFIAIDAGSWSDPRSGIDTAPLASAPEWLNPPRVERVTAAKPVQPSSGLSRYGEAALASACGRIVAGGPGVQEETLHRECFAIGTLAAAGGIPEHFARRNLLRAAGALRDYDARRPWRQTEIERKVDRSFAVGMLHPREALHG
jgi:Bifunctional DNA primase/polymerase, N-terminal